MTKIKQAIGESSAAQEVPLEDRSSVPMQSPPAPAAGPESAPQVETSCSDPNCPDERRYGSVHPAPATADQTPRTDRVAQDWSLEPPASEDVGPTFPNGWPCAEALLRHARQLERELADTREIEYLHRALKAERKALQQVAHERDALLEDLRAERKARENSEHPSWQELAKVWKGRAEAAETRAALAEVNLSKQEDTERENARREQKMRALLQEWLDTEMDSMDEAYEPWMSEFTLRVEEVLKEETS